MDGDTPNTMSAAPGAPHDSSSPSTPAAARTGQPPEGVAHPKTIKSYVRRAGRTTTGQAKAFEELGPRFVLNYQAAPLDALATYGRQAP